MAIRRTRRVLIAAGLATIGLAGAPALAVPPPDCGADMTGDGQATVQDLFVFLNAYFTQNAAADFNRAGGVTVQDVFDYLTAYFVGCP